MFKKPKNLKYTDMAIYIDNHIYTDDCDDNLIFEYLYFLCMMLAFKAKYFDSYKKYEDFAIHAATTVFLRLKNKKQFEYKENGESKLAPIRSILNYLKSSIYGLKVNFEQETYAQYSTQKSAEEFVNATEINLYDKMIQSIDELNKIEFKIYLEDIGKIVKEFLIQSPFYNDKKLWLNIYLSCLLTIQNSFTLPRKIVERLRNTNISPLVLSNLLSRTLKEQSKDPVILFHLPKDFHNYILIVTRKIKKLMTRDLSTLLHSYVSVDMNTALMLRDQIEDNNEN